MIRVAAKSTASDSGTTATSPPFSPFSPATSVASDNTGTSDDRSTEPADLGAFTSVFRALSQLQVTHPPRTMTAVAPSIEEDDDDDDDDTDRFDTPEASEESSDEIETPGVYAYDVESAVEAEDSRPVWTHEPIASYLVSAATPAPAQQLARLELNAMGGRGTYVDARPFTHEALLSQTLAHIDSVTPSVQPRTPGPGDPTLGALEQALGFLAAERTRVASQLDSSIEAEYAYRTEGKRRRRKRKKGVRDDPEPVLPLAHSTSSLHLAKLATASRGNSNSGSAQERTDTAVPSPSDGTSFSSSSADPRRFAVPVPPVPRRANPTHEIIASYSVPSPPPTKRVPKKLGRGPSVEGRTGPSYEPRGQGYERHVGYDGRMPSIGQRLNGSGSGSSQSGEGRYLNAERERLQIQTDRLGNGGASIPGGDRLSIQTGDRLSIQSDRTSVALSGESKVARLRVLATNLARRFPEDAGALRRAAEGGSGGAFDRHQSLLYVFVDHSNILVGFLEYIKKHPHLLPPRLKPKILHTALVLLLERGRPCARRILVASSPLHQTLDGVVGMGYEVSVLQRVEIKEGEEGRRPGEHRASSSRDLSSGDNLPRRELGSSEDDRRKPRARYREEAVDELLQLKLLQTILDTPPATIVLATGDGASSQFNPDGFVGCVRRAVDRGWMVELVAWEEGVSRAWKELERECRSAMRGGFRIVGLESWVGELVDY